MHELCRDKWFGRIYESTKFHSNSLSVYVIVGLKLKLIYTSIFSWYQAKLFNLFNLTIFNHHLYQINWMGWLYLWQGRPLKCSFIWYQMSTVIFNWSKGFLFAPLLSWKTMYLSTCWHQLLDRWSDFFRSDAYQKLFKSEYNINPRNNYS